MRIVPDLPRFQPSPVDPPGSGESGDFAALLAPGSPVSASRAAGFGELGVFGRHGAVPFSNGAHSSPSNTMGEEERSRSNSSAQAPRLAPMPTSAARGSPSGAETPLFGLAYRATASQTMSSDLASPPRADTSPPRSGFEDEDVAVDQVALPAARKPPPRREVASATLRVNEEEDGVSIVARVPGSDESDEEIPRRVRETAAEFGLSIVGFRLNGSDGGEDFAGFVSQRGGHHGDRTD